MSTDDRNDSSLGETIRKMAYLGVGAVFMTQEALSKSLGDLKLPKEVINGIVKQVDRNKAELIGIIRDELHGAFREMNWSKLLRESLDGAQIEFKVNIHYPNKAKPDKHGKAARSGDVDVLDETAG